MLSPAQNAMLWIPGVVVDTLTQHLEACPPVDDMVWTTERGQVLRRGSFGRTWRRAVAESVGPPCRIQDLRHTHAAWLIADGEHPKAIQTRLGHGSISVTMDRYGHLMDGLDDQIDLHLEARARAAAPPRAPSAPGTLPGSPADCAETPPDVRIVARSPDRIRTGVTALRVGLVGFPPGEPTWSFAWNRPVTWAFAAAGCCVVLCRLASVLIVTRPRRGPNPLVRCLGVACRPW